METYLTIDILLLASCIFELGTKKTKQKVIFIWMIFFTLFGGLRWETGGDWNLYKGFFDAAQWGYESILSYRRWDGDVAMEPGFMFLNTLVKSVVNEYWGFNLVMGFFAQYTYYRFSVEFSPKRPLLMYALILGMGMSSYMFVRSGLSVVVCYWAYQYIRDRKMIKFLLVVIAAGLIHRQVLLLIPLYWTVKLHFRWQVYVIGYLCCCAAYMVLQDYITLLIFSLGDLGDVTDKLQNYTDEAVSVQFGLQVSYSKWAMYFLMLCVFLYFRKKFNMEDDNWYNCMLVGFFIVILSNTIFTEGMTTLGRISTPYKGARTILVMIVVNRLLDSGQFKARRFAFAFFLGLAVINIYKDVTNPLMNVCFAPYRSIFDIL